MQGVSRSRWSLSLKICGLLSIFLICVARLAVAGPVTREDLLDVQFIDDKSGWASGRWGSVIHTQDGGKTWKAQKTGVDYTLAGIYFTDANNGWAVGDGGTIIHTVDGGKVWTKQKSPVKLFLTRVHFRNAQVGWAVGERTNILHTEDGGATWSVQFTDGDFILKSISFSDDNNGWAVGEYGYIYRTIDAGKTWTRQAGHFGMSEETGAIDGGTFLFDVFAVDALNAWAVGIEGHVMRTQDGGVTWEELKTGAPKTPFFGVTATTTGTIAIVGSGVIFTSSDSGVTWKQIKGEPTVAYGWLYSVASRPSGFTAVGWQGAIYQSDVKAEAWRRTTYE